MPALNQIRDQAADEPPKKGQTDEPTPNYYCLDSAHDPRLLTENRFFHHDPSDPGCPVCPTCKKEVVAQGVGTNAKGQPQIPANLLSLSDRIGERV